MRYAGGKPDCPTCFGAGLVAPAKDQYFWTSGGPEGPRCPTCADWQFAEMRRMAEESEKIRNTPFTEVVEVAVEKCENPIDGWKVYPLTWTGCAKGLQHAYLVPMEEYERLTKAVGP